MNTEPNNVLTASRMNSIARCPRAHYLQYEIGLQRESTGLALAIGSAWHRAIESRWKKDASFEEAFSDALPLNDTLDEYQAAKVSAMLEAYYEIYPITEKCEIVLTEQKFKFPLVGVKGFTVQGKLDNLIQREAGSEVELIEYKTTGDSIESNSEYWMRLRFNFQLFQYTLAARSLGYDVGKVFYDVARKAGLKPKMIDLLDKQGRKVVVDEKGDRVWIEPKKKASPVTAKKGKKKKPSEKVEREPRQTGDKNLGYKLEQRLESPEQYRARLLKDILSRPQFYFARKEVPILENDLIEFQAHRITIAKLILYFREQASKLHKPEQA